MAASAVMGADHVAPAGTTQVWVDIETLRADSPSDADVSGMLSGPNGDIPLTFESSPLGLTDVISTGQGSHSLDLTAAEAATVLVAMTFADAAGNILDQWSKRVTLAPSSEPTSQPEPSPTTPQATGTPKPTGSPEPTAAPSGPPTTPSAVPTSGSPASAEVARENSDDSAGRDGLAGTGRALAPWLVLVGAMGTAIGAGLLVRARRGERQ